MSEDLYTIPKDESLFPAMKYKSVNLSVTLPADLDKDFRAYAEKVGLNKSKAVAKLIENLLINAGVREKKA